MDGWGHRRIINLGAELARLRKEQGLSLRDLAKHAHCSYSLLSKIENNKTPLSRGVAAACDVALKTNGALIAAFESASNRIRPAQLPAAPPRLVGRKAELDAMTDGINGRPRGTPTVVAIDGPAGVGKTAIALRFAHQVADQYVDGQLYVDLHGFAPPGQSVSADTVLEEFLSAMGSPTIPDTRGKRASLYRSLLAERKVLIVLDNAADLDDIEPLLPAAAGCAVIVTSRRALSCLVGELGATHIAVPPLAEQDSTALLRQLIGEARADAEAESIATLARSCGNLPLALRYAADQLTIYPHRSVGDLVNELAENGRQLGALGKADLRTVLSWSYRSLGSDEARLFRLMGLHLGTHMSVVAVAALASVTRTEARRLLYTLASVHLLEFDSDDVLRLPDLIHAYARELVTTEDTTEQRTAAAQRLISWYVATVHEASRHLAPHSMVSVKPPSLVDGDEPLHFTDDLDAWTWCDTEKTNLEPIITMALQHAPQHVAHHLTTGLDVIGLHDYAHQHRDREPDSPDATRRGSTGQD